MQYFVDANGQSLTVRLNTPVQLGVYTFRDQNGAIIDLTPYASTFVELKLEGVVYTTETAAFVGAKTLGTVKLASYVFPTIGNWMMQFYCEHSNGSQIPGEPIRFEVVKNIRQAGLKELLTQ